MLYLSLSFVVAGVEEERMDEPNLTSKGAIYVGRNHFDAYHKLCVKHLDKAGFVILKARGITNNGRTMDIVERLRRRGYSIKLLNTNTVCYRPRDSDRDKRITEIEVMLTSKETFSSQ